MKKVNEVYSEEIKRIVEFPPPFFIRWGMSFLFLVLAGLFLIILTNIPFYHSIKLVKISFYSDYLNSSNSGTAISKAVATTKNIRLNKIRFQNEFPRYIFLITTSSNQITQGDKIKLSNIGTSTDKISLDSYVKSVKQLPRELMEVKVEVRNYKDSSKFIASQINIKDARAFVQSGNLFSTFIQRIKM